LGIGDESIGYEPHDGDIDNQWYMEVLDMNLMMDSNESNNLLQSHNGEIHKY
jgi:hypothetical protein